MFGRRSSARTARTPSASAFAMAAAVAALEAVAAMSTTSAPATGWATMCDAMAPGEGWAPSVADAYVATRLVIASHAIVWAGRPASAEACSRPMSSSAG
jgi:hypothetical protein